MTDHADLRAMLEALPALDISVHDGVTATVGSWLLRAPALVRALLEERDDLAEQLAAQPRADVYVTAASHNEAMRALEQERDALKAEVERLQATIGRIDAAIGGHGWVEPGDVVARAQGAVAQREQSDRMWRRHADDLSTDLAAVRAERDALKAEVERLRAKPVTPEQLFSSSKVIWEGWVRARDTEQGCVLDLFNYRVDRSRYVRVVEAEQPQKPVHPKWPADPVEPANPAEPISDELRLRCELAATVLAGLLANNEAGGVDGKADIAHSIADALLAEGRGRMAAEREGKP